MAREYETRLKFIVELLNDTKSGKIFKDTRNSLLKAQNDINKELETSSSNIANLNKSLSESKTDSIRTSLLDAKTTRNELKKNMDATKNQIDTLTKASEGIEGKLSLVDSIFGDSKKREDLLATQKKVNVALNEAKGILSTQKGQYGKINEYIRDQQLNLMKSVDSDKKLRTGLKEETGLNRSGLTLQKQNQVALEHNAELTAGWGDIMKMPLEQWRHFNLRMQQHGTTLTRFGGRLANYLRMITHGLRGFQMAFLGIMFAGMGLQKWAEGMLAPATKAYGFGEIWDTTKLVLFLPIIKEISGTFYKITSYIRELSPETKKWIGRIILGAFVLGGILYLVGSLGLAIGSTIIGFAVLHWGLIKLGSFITSGLIPAIRNMGMAWKAAIGIGILLLLFEYVGWFREAVGQIAAWIGGLVKHVPGLKDIGKEIEKWGKTKVVEGSTMYGGFQTTVTDQYKKDLADLENANASLNKGTLTVVETQKALSPSVDTSRDALEMQQVAIGNTSISMEDLANKTPEQIYAMISLANSTDAATLAGTTFVNSTPSLIAANLLAANSTDMATSSNWDFVKSQIEANNQRNKAIATSSGGGMEVVWRGGTPYLIPKRSEVAEESMPAFYQDYLKAQQAKLDAVTANRKFIEQIGGAGNYGTTTATEVNKQWTLTPPSKQTTDVMYDNLFVELLKKYPIVNKWAKFSQSTSSLPVFGDFIAQNGRISQFSPNDTLIGTKTPETVGGKSLSIGEIPVSVNIYNYGGTVDVDSIKREIGDTVVREVINKIGRGI